MKAWITAGLALSAVFTANAPVHAYTNYPWCISGDSRGIDCVFSTKEQCSQDGRNRGFGGQCVQNPAYRPGLPNVVQGGAVSSTTGTAPRTKRKSRHHES